MEIDGNIVVSNGVSSSFISKTNDPRKHLFLIPKGSVVSRAHGKWSEKVSLREYTDSKECKDFIRGGREGGKMSALPGVLVLVVSPQENSESLRSILAEVKKRVEGTECTALVCGDALSVVARASHLELSLALNDRLTRESILTSWPQNIILASQCSATLPTSVPMHLLFRIVGIDRKVQFTRLIYI